MIFSIMLFSVNIEEKHFPPNESVSHVTNITLLFNILIIFQKVDLIN